MMYLLPKLRDVYQIYRLDRLHKSMDLAVENIFPILHYTIPGEVLVSATGAN